MKSSYLAHGKVILIGEHSVVYGYDALAMPINSLHIKTTVEPAPEMWMDTERYQGPFFMAPNEYNGLKYVVKKMLELAASTEQLKISYTGQIPIERGLGSSATVALATTRAMDDYFKLNLTEEQILAITNHAEMINHGKASGLDAATVNSNYLVFFNQKDGPSVLKAKLGATLLIMDTGELGSTKEAVMQVHDQIKASPQAADKLKRLGKLADRTKTSWLNHDAGQIGTYFNEAQEILCSFGLSTAKIDQLQKIALAHQALGFKLSGSGLGGIVIALCKNQAVAQAIADHSQKIAVNSWIEEI
ncbi:MULTISPECIES: mevalonate kinase [unclassified Lactobacillus]|uniref:mevalonate kinase n=1 Tax=unclassified Lactobacillus TaxID=2620435 RepID=UPI00226AE18A|nr:MULTISPECIES: mevalonate kinase [unclassified Lactobacillus]MCX8721074.1 mevalonate kinase [Lactobacillus sp. B4010]MCX8732097.1 mevalonate kinase [Lactobacillus sp. B4015]MCX8734216.1 mevalonate kinase [Lactobacillus sp. B4012]